MNVCVTNIREKPNDEQCDDELWKTVYDNNKLKFNTYIKKSNYPIIIYDEKANIYEFNSKKFLKQKFVPEALKIFINNMYDGNVIEYLQSVSYLGVKVIFINCEHNRVNIKFIKIDENENNE